MSTAVFYHAGCSVCVSAEEQILNVLDHQKLNVEVVHFGDQASRISEAEKAGVKSVPALVVDGQVLHINFGASMEDVRKAVSA